MFVKIWLLNPDYSLGVGVRFSCRRFAAWVVLRTDDPTLAPLAHGAISCLRFAADDLQLQDLRVVLPGLSSGAAKHHALLDAGHRVAGAAVAQGIVARVDRIVKGVVRQENSGLEKVCR